MNNIAPLVAISASPAVLAEPLRDCDVYYPTFPSFPRPGVRWIASRSLHIDDRKMQISPFFPIKLYFRHVLYSLPI